MCLLINVERWTTETFQLLLNTILLSLNTVYFQIPQGCVFGPLLFLPFTSELVSILENKLIGYTNVFTLIAVVASPGVRVTEP